MAPFAASLLAGGISLYPKRTAFAEQPVCFEFQWSRGESVSLTVTEKTHLR